MAIISKVTIGTGKKVSVDYQSEDCSLIVTWDLESNDMDLLNFVRTHGKEVESAHQALRETMEEERKRKKNNHRQPFRRNNNRRNYNQRDDAEATEKQVETALDLQGQLGITEMDEETLTNLTRKEISDYIGDLMRQKREAVSRVGAR